MKNKTNEKKTNKNVINVIIMIILIILTFYIILKDSELSTIIYTIKNIDIKYFLLGILMALSYLLIGGYYLKMILKSLNVKTNFLRCFFYECSCFYFSAITPSSTGGQPAEIYYMAKDNIPPLISTIAILLITAVYKMVLVVLGVIILIYKPSFVFTHGLFFEITYILGLIINILFFIFCFMLMFSPTFIKKVAIWVINLLAKLKIIKDPEDKIIKLNKMIEEYKTSIDYLKHHKIIMFKTFIYAFIQRSAIFAVPYFIYRSFGYSGVSIIKFILIQTGVSLSIDSLPLPGGVGASELLFLNLYKDIYTKEVLTSAMLLSRGANYYFSLILTAFIVLGNHLKMIKENHKTN